MSDFEIHLTVDAPVDLTGLEAWAARAGLHFLCLDVADAAMARQPMLTTRLDCSLDEAERQAVAIVDGLAGAGFPVLRVKIETASDSEVAPGDDAAAAREPSERYFEHHVKLGLASGDDLEGLSLLAGRYAVRLSRNPRRMARDGRSERFLTQRCEAMGRMRAQTQLHALLDDLARSHYRVLGVIAEYVVRDTRPGLDAGPLERRP